MSMKRTIACLAITLTLAGCGSVPQPASRPVSQAQQPPPVEAALPAPAPAPAQPVAGALTEEEAQAAALPQPQIHQLLIARIYDGLGDRHPDVRDQLERAKHRILGLNLLQHRAVHAAMFQESKDKTLEALVQEWAGYLERPAELLAFVNRQIAKVEGKDIAATAQLARTLPDVLVALEKLPVKLQKQEAVSGPQAGPAAGLTGPELRSAVIRAMIEMMAAKDPADKPALERLGSRLAALSTREMRLIHADMWQELKGKTVAQVTDLLTTWFDQPATFLADMQQRQARVERLSAQARNDLLAIYPKALATMEELILAGPQRAAVGALEGRPAMPGMQPGMAGMQPEMAGMQPGMMGGCPCPMMRGAGQQPSG